MTPAKLARIRGQIERMRGTPQPAEKLENLARQLDRKLVKRGKEPTWESTEFDSLRPLSIPHHGSKDVPKGTTNSILSQLEYDVIEWEDWLREKDNG